LCVEGLNQALALCLMFVDQRREPQTFGGCLFGFLTRRLLTFFVASTVDRGALDGALEPMRLRLVAEVEQQ
jgi:hypothetical protein